MPKSKSDISDDCDDVIDDGDVVGVVELDDGIDGLSFRLIDSLVRLSTSSLPKNCVGMINASCTNVFIVVANNFLPCHKEYLQSDGRERKKERSKSLVTHVNIDNNNNNIKWSWKCFVVHGIARCTHSLKVNVFINLKFNKNIEIVYRAIVECTWSSSKN